VYYYAVSGPDQATIILSILYDHDKYVQTGGQFPIYEHVFTKIQAYLISKVT
jgi:hypothetical protein